MPNSNSKSINSIYSETKLMTTARIIVSVLMLLFMTALSFFSLTGTTAVEIITDNTKEDSMLFHIIQGYESVVYYTDFLPSNLIWLVYCLLIIFLLFPLLQKIPLKFLLISVFLWTSAAGIFWVYSSNSEPTEDSYIVSFTAYLFSSDYFDIFRSDSGYFQNYPYQLGYVFFDEIIMRAAQLFCVIKDFLFIGALNAVFLAFTYCGLIIINSIIFTDRRIPAVSAFLFIFAAQPVLSCSFIYGLIPGIAFAVYAVLFMLIYLKKNNFLFALLSAVFTAISIMIKTNNYIVMIALICFFIPLIFRRRHFIKDIVYLSVLTALSLSVNPAVKMMYEKRSGVEIGNGVPYVSWITMGLNEADNAPGWYNPDYSYIPYEENERNSEKTADDSKRIIRERISVFSSDSRYFNEFFSKKFISQWNETSYESIWNNVVRHNYRPRTKFAEKICVTDADKTRRYMDIYSQLVFICFLFSIFGCLKNKNYLTVILPAIISGGMIFHLIAEAKSQYAIPYFIIMTGFSAYGICLTYDFFAKKTENTYLGSFVFNSHHKKNKTENSVTTE